MTRYAIKNFMDTHDRLADSPDREMRFLRDELQSTQLGVSFARLAPSFRSSMGHHHREQEEAYVVVEGSGRVKLDDEIHDVRQWDVVRVAPEVVRAFEAGPDGLLLIAVGGPKPEGGDGVRDEDFWPLDWTRRRPAARDSKRRVTNMKRLIYERATHAPDDGRKDPGPGFRT